MSLQHVCKLFFLQVAHLERQNWPVPSQNVILSVSPTEMLSASQQHDSAYDSADFEGGCSSSNLQPNHLPLAEGTANRPSSTELHSHWPRDQASSVSSLTLFKKSLSKLDRRFSEPDMFSQGCQEGSMRNQKLTWEQTDITFYHFLHEKFSSKIFLLLKRGEINHWNG